MENITSYFIGLVGIILGFFFLNRKKDTTEEQVKEGVLASKQEEKKAEITTQEQELADLKKTKPEAEELTPEQAEEYWRNKK